MVKNPLCKAGDVGLIPGWGTKMPNAAKQPSLQAATTESTCSGPAHSGPNPTTRESVHCNK